MLEKIKKQNYKRALKEVALSAYSQIKAINNEIATLNIKDPQDAPVDVQNKLRALTLTLTLVNDIIHPAHRISKHLFDESDHKLIDYCMQAHKVAVESKLVDPCNCSQCNESDDFVESDKE